MPVISGVQQGEVRGEVHGAIARASAATGVAFDYLLAQAKLESGLDPSARANSSTAAGLFQFISGTWLETLDRHGAAHGLGWAGAAIEQAEGRSTVADPVARARIMALRFHPDASALMAAELARDNAAELRGFLGREPEPVELYLAHFLGAAGARKFLGALHGDPRQVAAGLFPEAAEANRPIFFAGGRALAVGEVMDLLRAKVAGAMGDGAGVAPARGFHRAPNAVPFPSRAILASPRTGVAQPSEPLPRRLSMAETLRGAFGAADHLPEAASDHIDRAYGKIRAFGL